MNSISLAREGDPDDADGIVWPGLYRKLRFGMDSFEMVFWIIGVCRILGDLCHFQCTTWRGLFFAAHRGWIECQQVPVFAQST